MAWEQTAHWLAVSRHGLRQATEMELGESAEEVALLRRELPALTALAGQLGSFLAAMRQIETHLSEGYAPHSQPASVVQPTQIWEG